MKLAFAFLFCFFINTYCSGQLQIRPPKEDTMSNAGIANWYAGKYKELIGLTDKQTEKTYQILLINRNYLDSLKSKNALTTDELVKNNFSLDKTLKTVFTDIQYDDYLNTANIWQVSLKK